MQVRYQLRQRPQRQRLPPVCPRAGCRLGDRRWAAIAWRSVHTQHGSPRDPVVRKVRERIIGPFERVGTDGRTHAEPWCERQQLLTVTARVGGHAAQLALGEEVRLVVERRDLREVDAGDGEDAAAVERRQHRSRALVDPGVSPDEPTDRKVRLVVEARVRLFEAIAPSARAARVWAHRHGTVRDLMVQSRAGLRTQLRLLFAGELDGRAGLLPALDALCAFETYDLLRSDQGLSRPATVDALAVAVLALVARR